jgi:hypothetical protein
MTLNKQHRECLLDELQKATEDLDLQKQCLLNSKNDHLKDRWEIHIFLAEQRIKLIQQSLIDNEIDF